MVLSSCGGSDAASAGSLTSVVAAGDSITLRTGLCVAGQALADCTAAQSSTSWAAYLPEATSGTWVVQANLGRGGDTCTAQAPWVGGVFDGVPRGLLGRLQQVIDSRAQLAILLIGINDVMLYGVTPGSVASCVAQARATLQAAGIQVLVLTYPPVTAATAVFGLTDADVRLAALNAALLAGGAVDTRAAWPDWAAAIYTSDGVHPMAPGAVSLALQVARAGGAL